MESLSLLAVEQVPGFVSLGEFVLALEGFVITVMLLLCFIKLSKLANKD